VTTSAAAAAAASATAMGRGRGGSVAEECTRSGWRWEKTKNHERQQRRRATAGRSARALFAKGGSRNGQRRGEDGGGITRGGLSRRPTGWGSSAASTVAVSTCTLDDETFVKILPTTTLQPCQRDTWATQRLCSPSPKNPAHLQYSCKRVPNRPLRPRRGRFSLAFRTGCSQSVVMHTYT